MTFDEPIMTVGWSEPNPKPENVIQTFWNTSETFVSEGGNSLQQSGMIYRRDRLDEYYVILQNPWKSMGFHCFSLIFIALGDI